MECHLESFGLMPCQFPVLQRSISKQDATVGRSFRSHDILEQSVRSSRARWMHTIIIILMWFILCTEGKEHPDIDWRISGTRHRNEVQHLSVKIGDEVQIFCSPGYSLYEVTSKSYELCADGQSTRKLHKVLIHNCTGKASKLNFVLYSPVPGSKEYRPKKTYYFLLLPQNSTWLRTCTRNDRRMAVSIMPLSKTTNRDLDKSFLPSGPIYTHKRSVRSTVSPITRMVFRDKLVQIPSDTPRGNAALLMPNNPFLCLFILAFHTVIISS